MAERASGAVILVVDDDEDHGFMLEAMLTADGYEVVLATSRTEAQEILAARAVDVLVADLSLGDGTALDLVKPMGARKPKVSVVLSGFDSQEDIERTRLAGYDAHLGKPTPVETLRALIREGLDRPSDRAAILGKGVAEKGVPGESVVGRPSSRAKRPAE